MQRLYKLTSWILNHTLFRFRYNKPKDGEICYVSGARRCFATLIDLVILILALQLVHGAFFFAFPKDEATFKVIEKHKMGGELSKEEKLLRNRFIYKAIVLQVIQLVMVFVYSVYMWVRFSATIGKLLMFIKVVDEKTLEAMSVRQASKRFFSMLLSCIPLCLGIIWSNFDSRKRAWHDMMAKTVVVTSKSLRRHKELNCS